jgi:ABC-type transport system involved in multi-copper enzyme maturation permease subunit
MIGLGAVFSAVAANEFHTFGGADQAGFDPIGTSLNGITFAQLAIGVLGVLAISGEYAAGTIHSSLTVVPRRLPVLWGKVAVFATTVFSVSLISSLISFFLGQALLSGQHLDVAITSTGALRAVIGAALYLTAAGVIGIALGALVRNTAAGISTFVGVFFVIPPLTNLLPASIGSRLTRYLPSNAGTAIYSSGHDLQNSLSSGAGFAFLCAEVTILIGAAAYRLLRVDA